MRIAYLVSQYPAPSHTFIRREIEALRKRNVEVHTFSIRKPSAHERSAPADEQAYSETFYVLPPNIGRYAVAHLAALASRPLAYFQTLAMSLQNRAPGLRGLLWAFFYFVEAIVLSRALQEKRVQHLHTHFANAAANAGVLAAHFAGITFSLTLHGISETDYPSGLLLPSKIRAASFVACASYFMRAQAMRIVEPEHWHKLIIVRCPLDLSVLPTPRRSPRERPRVICVGRLSPEKGHHGLLEAFAKVRKEGLDAELRLVGAGPERASIEKAIRSLGLENDVVLMGMLPERDTLAEIADSDLLVSSSLMEGLPVVLVEALALRVPVISACIAGVPELVKHGENGLLFSASNWDALSQCLSRSLSDPMLRERQGRAGRATVEAEFATDVAVEPLYARLVTLYGQPEAPVASARAA